MARDRCYCILSVTWKTNSPMVNMFNRWISSPTLLLFAPNSASLWRHSSCWIFLMNVKLLPMCIWSRAAHFYQSQWRVCSLHLPVASAVRLLEEEESTTLAAVSHHLLPSVTLQVVALVVVVVAVAANRRKFARRPRNSHFCWLWISTQQTDSSSFKQTWNNYIFIFPVNIGQHVKSKLKNTAIKLIWQHFIQEDSPCGSIPSGFFALKSKCLQISAWHYIR
jgi:hypothetical protein